MAHRPTIGGVVAIQHFTWDIHNSLKILTTTRVPFILLVSRLGYLVLGVEKKAG